MEHYFTHFYSLNLFNTKCIGIIENVVLKIMIYLKIGSISLVVNIHNSMVSLKEKYFILSVYHKNLVILNQINYTALQLLFKSLQFEFVH